MSYILTTDWCKLERLYAVTKGHDTDRSDDMICRTLANKLLLQAAWDSTGTWLSSNCNLAAACLHTSAQLQASFTSYSGNSSHFTAVTSEQLQQRQPGSELDFSSRSFWTTTASATADDAQTKRHAMKCNTAAGTPVSQAVACMVDRDVMPRQQLCAKMDQLSQELAQDVAAFSSTELSAFTEACRKMEYHNTTAFKTIIQQLAPSTASISADELPSLLWAASTLASKTPAGNAANSSSSSSSGSSSSIGIGVPQNDGVIGSVSSSRIAGMPEVVEFMLGVSEVLSGDLADIDEQELPIIAAALADLEYRDPFLLTVLAESVLESKQHLSERELLELLQSFASMGRWFFDNRVLDQLTVELVERAKNGAAAQQTVVRVAECLAGVNHKNKVLAEYLQKA